MAKLVLLANAASPHTEKWASELARRGWQVEIISFLPASIPSVKVHVTPPFFGAKADVLIRRSWIKKEIARIRPDLVHAHYATSFGLLGALAGRHPLLISAWGSDVFSFPRKSILHRKLLEWTLKRADVLCSTSRVMAREMQRYVGEEREIEVIPFGVDVEYFTPPRTWPGQEGPVGSERKPVDLDCVPVDRERDGPAPGRDMGVPVPQGRAAAGERVDPTHPEGDPEPGGRSEHPVAFGVAKYLQPVYGLDVLLRAFAELERRLPGRAVLRIAGDGPDKNRLHKLAKHLEVWSKVEWSGLIPNRRVAAFYRELDVVVVPSHQESFGVTAVEGSACGRPIIASKVGGLPEVVTDHETGLLIPPGNVRELSAAMEYMVRHPAERRRFGEAGRRFVLAKYNWMENVSQMERVYRRLLG
ncbi:Glycosyltransferase subfamily 4-like, N-terminal domain protein [Acididesulfobacillus acetoxydans]|uniref:Glycosyl transferase group 1 n=1 Tax=Acididesulfobacillus acetoxydans TaxID=1561005 RepID=A0A8S0VVJ3_9FIRM|nr:glycosyltransferase [Acididesulfobacillus acetoxydans]CAA7599623.1 Glycosyltransferase subfamily 4-like, N-terminal domain protein [Acididesulfobacillus acetoxydans]CEJ06466.1 Glycosyl transferase group 1 [Acididesulfobacillus acetoxydans]